MMPHVSGTSWKWKVFKSARALDRGPTLSIFVISSFIANR